MCPLHTQSLSTVIGAGKPVAALFATPARCQSAYCAPVLDEFLDTIKPYGDQIVPVHIEIYQKPTGTALVPTVEAWRLAERAVAVRRSRPTASCSRASTARSAGPR